MHRYRRIVTNSAAQKTTMNILLVDWLRKCQDLHPVASNVQQPLFLGRLQGSFGLNVRLGRLKIPQRCIGFGGEIEHIRLDCSPRNDRPRKLQRKPMCSFRGPA